MSGSRSFPLPDDFAVIATGLSINRAATVLNVSHKLAKRWFAEAGIEPYSVQEVIPAPDDFEERAAYTHLAGLCRYYGRSHKTVKRWAREKGVTIALLETQPKAPKRAPKRIKAKKLGAVKGKMVLPGVPWMPSRDSSTEGRAADYLRRRGYRNVHRCDMTGRFNPKGKFWRAGNAVLSPKDLIARAEAKGWSADEWQRIAA